jgi:hypothetical protein
LTGRLVPPGSPPVPVQASRSLGHDGEPASASADSPVGILARALLRAVIGASPAELPALVGALAQAQAVALARLTTPAVLSTPPAPGDLGRWITADEAAAIAAVSRKCVYEWAQGRRWASRPTRRCLRIDEAGFRSWLANRLHP